MNPVNGEMMRDMQSLGYAAQFAVAKPLYSQVRDLLAAQIAGGGGCPGSGTS